MPRPAKRNTTATTALPIPTTFEIVAGEVLVRAKAAAKLAGVHPVAMEMLRKLQAEPSKGAAFKLGDKAMLDRALDIERVLVKDMRKMNRALGGGFKVRSARDGDRLIFWLDAAA